MRKNTIALTLLLTLTCALHVGAAPKSKKINIYPEQIKYVKGTEVESGKTDIFAVARGKPNKTGIIGKKPGKDVITIDSRQYAVNVSSVPKVKIKKILTYQDQDLYEIKNSFDKSVSLNCISEGIYRMENDLVEILPGTTGYAVITKDSTPVVSLATNVKKGASPRLREVNGFSTVLEFDDPDTFYARYVVGYDEKKNPTTISVYITKGKNHTSCYGSTKAKSWKLYTVGNVAQ